MRNNEKQIEILKRNNEEVNAETRKSIQETLVRLMKQQEYRSIRMTDIIRESGISRAGVYNNYKSKDEILYDVVALPMQQIVDNYTRSISANWGVIFDTAYQHREMLLAVMDAGLAQIFLEKMNEGIDDYYLGVWAGIFLNLVYMWAKKGFPESPEELAQKVDRIMHRVSREIHKDTGEE